MFHEPIEAVTVCIGYDDFLSQIVPFNRPIFSRWVIVTSASDSRTREVCRRFNLDVVLSEDHRRGADEFAKGRLVERGLQHLRSEGWRVHIDADVALPSQTRHLLDAAHLDHSCIHGVDRVMVKTWHDWQRLKASGYLADQHDYHHRIRWPEGFHIGARWASISQGWVPIGFFQLWHSSQDEWNGTRIKTYPRAHGNACRSDVQHGLQWDRRKRILIPEIVAVHLESEPCKTGTNWAGRKTKRFGPPEHHHGPCY